MSEPDREPTETPTTDSSDAEAEGKWMIRNWVGIAVISILGLLLIAIALLQVTGLIDPLAPIADTAAQQRAVIGVLAVAVLAIAGWSWSSILG